MRDKIKKRLDEINLVDLSHILQTPEGRRFFNWILEACGRDTQDFKGNSRDVFLAGMRNVAVMLVAAGKALGLQGLDLMHQAEKEYIILQMDIAEEIKKKEGDNNK
jgi:hypothetical protein